MKNTSHIEKSPDNSPVAAERRQFLRVAQASGFTVAAMAATAGTAAAAGALEGLLNQFQEDPQAILSGAAEEHLGGIILIAIIAIILTYSSFW